jgi:isoleucyl-tRNA synthetase
MDFVVDDLSNWYVRVTRERFWAPDGQADAAAVATLRESLVAVSRLLAPAAPFASDWLHRSLAGTSVHLAGWPVAAGAAPADEGLGPAMDAIRRLASLARAARETARLRVRQPLARMQVAVPTAARGPIFDRLLAILRAEVNVKQIEPVASDTDLVRLRPKANFRSLGKRYGKDTPLAAAAAQRLSQDQLRILESGGSAEVTDENGRPFAYFAEDVAVGREVTTDWLVASDGPFVAALDPTITPALAAEGLARELISHIQRLRREAGYAVTDRIALGLTGPEVVVEAAQTHAPFIQDETLARRLAVGTLDPAAELTQEVEIEGQAVTISIRRHDGGT